MTFLKSTITILLLFFCIYLTYINVKLYYRPAFSAQSNTDVAKQFKYISAQMKNGADDDMQRLFPEGYMFMNALHGISAAELAANATGTLREEALLESYRCYVKMNTDKARSIFPDDLILAHGAYYRGWSAYHMAKLIAAQKEQRDEELVEDFKKNCSDIAKAMNYSQTPYLESFHNWAWPADMMMCIAALAEHDELFEPQYGNVINAWLDKVKERLDPLGMLPHRVDAIDGKPAQNARGCSMSLMLCFLKDIDRDFYQEQYALYKQYFVTTRFGLPGISEYPKGTEGDADADSGPVLLGVGGSASIVGVRVLAAEKELPTAIALRNSIEAFGMSIQHNQTKKYLFGALPMADAFIMWANSTELQKERELIADEPWKRMFQLYTGAIFAIVLLSVYLLWRKGEYES